jgi:hypothetical protein
LKMQGSIASVKGGMDPVIRTMEALHIICKALN